MAKYTVYGLPGVYNATPLSLNDGDGVALAVTQNGYLVVVNADGSSIGGGTEYTDGGVPPVHPKGGTIEWSDGSNWQTVSTAKPLPVSAIITPSGTQDVNLTKVGGTSFALGQQLAAASLPVVLTAAQISTLTPLGTVAVTQSTSPWVISGAVTEASLDAALISQEATTSGVKGLTVFGAVTTNAPSYTTAKSDALSLDTSGLLRVSLKDTPANTNKLLVTPDSVALPANQSVNISQVNGGSTAVTGIVAGSLAVGGDTAAAVTDTGNPVKVGGKYNLTIPTLTDGQRGDLQLDSRNHLRTTLFFSGGSVGLAGGADNADGGAVTATASRAAILGRNYILNPSGTPAWDRQYGVGHGSNTSGTGITAAGIMAEFDDTSPTSITENQFGNVRMSANRNVYSTIRDAAGNERGLNVDANGAIAVTATNATASNLKVAATLDAETTKVIGTARIIGNGGATLDATIGAATAPTNMVAVGGVYNSTEITLTNGQSAAQQLDSKGRMRGVIMDAAANSRGANVTANNELNVLPTQKDTFAAAAAFTITLASLANSTAGVGRQSTLVTSNTAKSALIMVKFTVGTTPVANSLIYVYLIRGDGSINDDNAGASDAGITIINAPLLGTILCSAATNNTAYYGMFDTKFLGSLGPTFGIAVVNSTNVTANSTGGNFTAEYTLIT